MTWTEIVLIFLAGIGAGTINTIVGSGTLITFPTLLAFGLPPVTATMSNAVGLVPGNISGTWGYRRELAGQWRRLRWQLPASLLGALLGAWLLLHLPANAFESIVPVLLVLALLLVIFQTRIQRWVRARSEKAGRDHEIISRQRMVLLVSATFLTGIYGGYFAAAQGIMLMGLMGALLPDKLQNLNAAKNVLTLLVNAVSALTYTLVAFDRINWGAAGLIAVGSLIGGFLGAGVGRRLSPVVLRCIIVALGSFAIVRILL
ncbi:sulfite exporter TauE/SafE family protein [Nakamurella antarctica]|uniref:Probable membrane transporter protein n=1 Tax=Nakamurella antarctica TaxID=1902245 RepID=A0A3G8ZI42_9ACTN|nr:sulfite exporter TauE/SafE family protein [Nakamurella antarctica]AZI57072.1 sulfite exporter TauE/SafE family protein [Nakamurella antarctica]